MSRNGSGTYTKVNTFVAGTTITASGHNQNWDDISTEITNSVAADGQTSMTGVLKHSNGSASAPSMTFASDTNTGLYRSAADEVSITLGGTQKLVVSATDVTFAGNSLAGMVGVIHMYFLTVAPTGWILMRGQAATLASYPLQRAALINAGSPYGTSGSDPKFPNMMCRVPAGLDDGTVALLTGGQVMGAALGAETRTLATGNLPAYTPAGSVSQITPAGSVATTINNGTNIINNAGGVSFGGGPVGGAVNITATSTFTGTPVTPTFTGTAQGGISTPVGVVQPTIVINFIARAI